jgi:hypothetical protein
MRGTYMAHFCGNFKVLSAGPADRGRRGTVLFLAAREVIGYADKAGSQAPNCRLSSDFITVRR